MALCMVVLGLRVAEVAGLTLADLDTTAGTLRLSAGKPRRDRVLSMSCQLLEQQGRVGRLKLREELLKAFPNLLNRCIS